MHGVEMGAAKSNEQGSPSIESRLCLLCSPKHFETH